VTRGGASYKEVKERRGCRNRFCFSRIASWSDLNSFILSQLILQDTEEVKKTRRHKDENIASGTKDLSNRSANNRQIRVFRPILTLLWSLVTS
jgi:hypothetical protein